MDIPRIRKKRKEKERKFTWDQTEKRLLIFFISPWQVVRNLEKTKFSLLFHLN